MGQPFARQRPEVPRLDAEGLDQIWQGPFEVPSQIPRKGALIVTLGVIGTIFNECSQKTPQRQPSPLTGGSSSRG